MDLISREHITSYAWNNSWTVYSYELRTCFVANKGIPRPFAAAAEEATRKRLFPRPDPAQHPHQT